MPATSGASGPGTTRSMAFSTANLTRAGKSSVPMSMLETLLRPRAVPPFPVGIQLALATEFGGIECRYTRRDKHSVDLRRLRELPGEGVLSPTVTDHKDLHC